MCQQGRGFIQQTGYGMYFGGFDHFRKGHIGQNGRESFGKHTFSGAGTADKQQIMSPAGGNFQCPFGGRLSLDIGKINRIKQLLRCGKFMGDGSNRLLSSQMTDQFQHMTDRHDINAFDYRPFTGVVCRYKKLSDTFFLSLYGHRKNTVDGAHFSAER